MTKRIIGIDLAVTAQHKAVVLDATSDEFVSGVLTFRATPAELERLLRQARAGADETVQLVAMLEATGMAWYPVGVYLHQHGVQVYRVNGQQTRALRKVYWRHAGSDRIDSRVLAHLYRLVRERVPAWRPPNGEQLALQRACREYDRWRQIDIAIQNRLQDYDQWAWGGLRQIVPTVARDWMRQTWYDPWQVAHAGVAHLTSAWQAFVAPKSAATEWIPAWVRRAEQMTQLYGSAEMVGYAQLQALLQRELAHQADSIQARRELSEQVIMPLYRKLEPEDYLSSIKGIGLASAAVYIAFIQDIARFPTIAQFRKWTGMVPSSHQSGAAQASGLPLTHAGPNLVKATLYRNADVARQWDVQLAKVYYQQMVAYGKHHTQAVCACASHLANRIYTILKEQRPYELRDLDDNPITAADARDLCLTRYRVPEEVRQRNNVRARRARAQQQVEQRFMRQRPD